MFESLNIRNYRVFDDLEMNGLHRVNLIAGRNNTGKTSLLEAILLLCGAGNPQPGANANVLRATDFGRESVLHALETLWKNMFHALDIGSPIEIEGVHSKRGEVRLEISIEAWHGAPQPSPNAFDGTPMSQILDGKALTLRYKERRCADETQVGQVHPVPAGLEVNYPDTPNPISARAVFSRTGDILDDAELLGNLRLRKHGDFLLDALRIIEPNLASVEVMYTGGTPMIWGDIGLSELVPLPAMGEGMTRLARILLGMSSVPGGVMLVDEIESGIHHSAMVGAWKAIGQAAERFDVQVFATTHSFEWLEKAVEALTSEGFRYFRTSIIKQKGAVSYDPEQVDLAVRLPMEIR